MDSAGVGTVTVAVEVAPLLAKLMSVVALVTVAVLETVVPELTCITRVMVGEPPAATRPSVQVTVTVPLQEPCDGVAETNVVFAGRTSVTVTPDAAFGPRLPAVMV